MDILREIYSTYLYIPLFNALIFLYNLIPGTSIGIAIILMTLIIRFILYPFSKSSIVSQRALQKLQPEMTRIREKYKDDQEKQSQELMKLYSKHKVNPLSSCLPLIIQLPVILAIYRVFQHGLASSESLDVLYPFIHNPGSINPMFLGIFDLSQPKNIIFALIAGGLQFLQSWMLMKKTKKQEADAKKSDQGAVQGQPRTADEITKAMTKNMVYFFPLITVWFGYVLPAGLSLYWIVTTLFAIGQQWLLTRKEDKQETAEASRVQ